MHDYKKVPDDFDPWKALDALQGTTEAILWHLTEGPASEKPMSSGALASVQGLTFLAARLARELNAYFRVASEGGLQLPVLEPDADSDNVRETSGIYRVN